MLVLQEDVSANFTGNNTMKPLGTLLEFLGLPTDLNTPITDLTSDSRQVQPGSLFCALKGGKLDGHHFIADALKRGASAILCEQALDNPQHTPIFVIPDLYRRLGEFADFFYDAPSKCLKIIGITGTNGKTSTAHYIAELLYFLGEQVAVIGTVGNGMWGKLITGERTTPDALSLHKMFHDYIQQGCHWVIMEVSSHALQQNRVDGVRFYSTVFTNLTQDHLDYHHTMEAYGLAKAKLFQKSHVRTAVLNQDDLFSQKLMPLIPLHTRCVLYHVDPDSLSFDRQLQFDWYFNDRIYPIRTGLLGTFNASNLAGALTVLAANGFDPVELAARASLLHPVKGRMEALNYNHRPLIVIDYAHTPDALEKALINLKRYGRKVWVLFGCGGNRDRSKRLLMAVAAEKYADYIIVTEDNTRFETIDLIFADIRAGFQNPARVRFIESRREAIHFVITQAKSDEIILLAGKGHETYLEKNGHHIHFDEREVIKAFLQQQND